MQSRKEQFAKCLIITLLQNIPNRTVASIPRIQSALKFFMDAMFCFAAVVHKYLNLATFSKDLLATFI
jgi:hypothetical protein